MNEHAGSVPNPGDEPAFLVNVGPNIGLELQRRAEVSGVSVDDIARRGLLDWMSRVPYGSPLRGGSVRLDIAKRSAIIGGRSVHLSPLEMRLLAVLLQRPGEMLSTEEIKDLVWGPEMSTSTRALAVHVCRLREKLGSTAQIRSLRRQGYWLEFPPLRAPQPAEN